MGQHGNLQSLSSPEQPLDVLPAPPSWGGTLPGGLHFTPMSTINIWPPLPSQGVHKCATCVPYVPHRPLLLRKRPGNEHVRRGRREDGWGKYEKRDEGACPQVLVLGSTARYTVPRGAPRRDSGPSSWVRPDRSQEPSEALAVREKLSSTLALARYQTALCVREGPRPHRQSQEVKRACRPSSPTDGRMEMSPAEHSSDSFWMTMGRRRTRGREFQTQALQGAAGNQEHTEWGARGQTAPYLLLEAGKCIIARHMAETQ